MNLYKQNMMTILCILSLEYAATIKPIQENNISAEHFKQAPQLFETNKGAIGKYWSKTKYTQATVLIGDDEFREIIVIKLKNRYTKKSKKLIAHKEYLGSYKSLTTNQEYLIYGVQKQPKPLEDGPDDDVITTIAIKEDFGIGE